jgi:signal transduction histidine kinase
VRLTASASHAIIEIIDKGIGIAPADQARIFERFYRVEGKHSRQGFGLGLAIARQLVAGQRGTIELESAAGAGSTFRIKLPLLHTPKDSPARAGGRWSFVRRGGAAEAVYAERETS